MTRPPRPTPVPHEDPSCDLELLTLFSAGELDAADRDIVTAHLIDCERCWDELEAQRCAIRAVHTLWEPAPAGLRADVRAAINEAQFEPRHRLGRMLLLAAVVIATVSAAGFAVDRLSSTTHHRAIATSAPIPASIQAAITQAGTTPAVGPRVPPAPKLSAVGLYLTASGAATAGDIAAAQYLYRDAHGHLVTVFVASRQWPRPVPALAVSTRTWVRTSTTPTVLTIVGGPDRAGENMLVLASDHTAAMTAAAELGLV